MGEKVGETPPVERLRLYFLEAAKRGSRPERVKCWPPNAPNAVANQKPKVYGYYEDLESDDPEMQILGQQSLQNLVEKSGLSSLDEFRVAMDELREQLREELLPESWSAYFD